MSNSKNDEYLPFCDISEHQRRLDAAVMENAGVVGLIMRSSDGREKVDEQWLPFLKEASTSRLLLGAYHFARPHMSAATEQARFWLRTVRRGVESIGRPLDLPLMCDVEKYHEKRPPLPGPEAVIWLRQFLDVVESEGADLVGAGARTPSIYTGLSAWKEFMDNSAAFGRHGLVLARYPTQRQEVGADGKQRTVDRQPPARAAEWAAFAWSLKANPSPPLLPGFNRWDAWQFSGDGNNGGPQVGVGSQAVDCNIFLAETVRNWTGSSTPITDVRTTTLVVEADRDATQVIVNSLPEVKPGQSGAHVGRVQALVLAAGFDPGGIDGVYTTKETSPTLLAIKAFQQSRGLTADGTVGIKQTWPALLGV